MALTTVKISELERKSSVDKDQYFMISEGTGDSAKSYSVVYSVLSSQLYTHIYDAIPKTTVKQSEVLDALRDVIVGEGERKIYTTTAVDSLYNNCVHIDDSQTVTGSKTFSGALKKTSSLSEDDNDVLTLKDIDSDSVIQKITNSQYFQTNSYLSPTSEIQNTTYCIENKITTDAEHTTVLTGESCPVVSYIPCDCVCQVTILGSNTQIGIFGWRGDQTGDYDTVRNRILSSSSSSTTIKANSGSFVYYDGDKGQGNIFNSNIPLGGEQYICIFAKSKIVQETLDGYVWAGSNKKKYTQNKGDKDDIWVKKGDAIPSPYYGGYYIEFKENAKTSKRYALKYMYAKLIKQRVYKITPQYGKFGNGDVITVTIHGKEKVDE